MESNIHNSAESGTFQYETTRDMICSGNWVAGVASERFTGSRFDAKAIGIGVTLAKIPVWKKAESTHDFKNLVRADEA